MILITGATGTIGKNLIKLLEGMTYKTATRKDGVDFHQPQTIRRAMKDVTSLFLLTPFSEDMVAITKLLVDTAKEAGVKHIVKISAVGAATNALFNIGRWHFEAERIVTESGIPCAIIRPNVFMQNLANFDAQTIKTQQAIYNSAREGKAAFVDARDVAAVCAKALLNNLQGTYEVSGPASLNYESVAAILTDVIGIPIKYVGLTDEQAEQGMMQMGMPAWMIEGFLGLARAARAGHLSTVTDTVEKITGKKPRPFKQFVQDYHSWFKP